MTEGVPTKYPPNWVPADRRGSFEEVAGAVLYIVGKEGAYLNGAVQIVDGGGLSVMPAIF